MADDKRKAAPPPPLVWLQLSGSSRLVQGILVMPDVSGRPVYRQLTDGDE